MIRQRQPSSLWRVVPQTGDSVANVSDAHTSGLELIEIVMPADFETIND
jgi:hypothetical protein